ncbi:MAG: hypothetical protein R6X25_09970 [Candidatus Krumholzibacteriia bacterium]
MMTSPQRRSSRPARPTAPVALAVAMVLSAATMVLFAAGGAAEPLESGDDLRFVAVDILVDSGRDRLAAWQLDITDPTGRARIVGVEGGEHPAFADPPHHDPRALQRGHIILAAYSTADDLPRGLTRVARLHLTVEGTAPPHLRTALVAAADPDGRRIDAGVTWREADRKDEP